MKKIFFPVLVAVVAIGGAYATEVYPIGSTENIGCPPGLISCDLKMGADFLASDTPAPNQPNRYLLSTISWDGGL